MNFKDFKAKQGELTDAIKKMAEKPKTNYTDEREWKFIKDGSGNANATLRFLPQQDLSKSPVLLTFRHAFQNEGRWFIEECPHTIGEKCPVCETSSGMWNSDEDTARQYWRNKVYVANILVVDDEGEPENNGKVFLWKFGKQIYDIIMEAVQPEDEDEEGVNVFDFDKGANFKFKCIQKGGFNNYQKSKFQTKCSAIKEAEQEAVFNAIIDTDEFKAESLFKTYDEILKKFSGVIGINSSPMAEKSAQPAKEEKPQFDLKEPEDTSAEDDEEFDFDSLLDDDDDEKEKFNPDE
jgi:hypothetical protein